MQTHKTTLAGLAGSFPNADSYNLIFLTATLVSFVSIGLSIILKRQLGKSPLVH